jgi:hypothetical protein
VNGQVLAAGVGKPAAWISTDGRTWRKASVPGDAGAGVGLTRVVAGADGLFALGRRAGSQAATYWARGAPTSGWASADGLTWRFVGDLGTYLPYLDGLAGDGSHMVLFGRTSATATTLKAWTSTDGVTWTRLAFSGSTSIQSIDRLDTVRVAPDGVVVYGGNTDAGPLFWFATATGP